MDSQIEKRINLIILSFILLVTTGCSEETVTELTATVTNELLQGTWITDCEIKENNISSFTTQVTFIESRGDFNTTEYSDSNCTDDATLQTPQEFTYVLGKEIDLEVSGIEGITKAAEIDLIFDDVTQLDLIAIDNLTSLYFGEEPPIDTSGTRPTSIEDLEFKLQVPQI